MIATAFLNHRRIAHGPLADVARTLHALPPDAMPLVFDDATGRAIDLDLRGTEAQAVARHAPPPKGRGRPKLGVTAREITLLPGQWDWLAAQPGGASVVLRKLVHAAMQTGTAARAARRDAAWRVMSALAGDLPGFEEAARALYAGDPAAFARHAAPWPADVRSHILHLWQPELPTGAGA
ncbi:DUF2239 family protein [Gemmobacter sp.]|uniref:DUF2239 family protein n=1 Tax=Gemmobacter sp. TaxID=1898957 RepID=UPI002AFF3D8E|nr:DUF2239 family protein [Gemmobacter sp.]